MMWYEIPVSGLLWFCLSKTFSHNKIDQSKILSNKWGDVIGKVDFQKFVSSFIHQTPLGEHGIQVLRGTVFWGSMGMGRHLLLGGRSLWNEMKEVYEEHAWLGATLRPFLWGKHEDLKNTNTFFQLLLNQNIGEISALDFTW